jgi:hypothetical protein
MLARASLNRGQGISHADILREFGLPSRQIGTATVIIAA